MTNYHRVWFCIGLIIATTIYVIWTLAIEAWR